ncbi:hypothetical protein ACVMII_003887 [Bradyrhizobium diazoefficiens]
MRTIANALYLVVVGGMGPVAALASLCVFCSLAKAQVVGDNRIVRDPSFGCKDLGDYRELSELYQRFNFEAARGFMAAKKDDCIFFDPGALVTIDRYYSRPRSAEECVRPEKEDFVCFWIKRDALGVPDDLELLKSPEQRKGEWLGRQLRRGTEHPLRPGLQRDPPEETEKGAPKRP